MKTPNCYAGEGDRIPRPPGYFGTVVFEGELGVVIGKRCQGITPEQASDHIFGYTCVNDVTARDLMKQDIDDRQMLHYVHAYCCPNW